MARVFSPVLPTLPIWKAHGPDTSTAVLTYPVHDSEGEWVQPDGGDWSTYPRNPLVNWHHDVPVGRGEVTLKMIAVKGKNWVVPVGTTRFFEADLDLDGLDLRILDPRTGQPTAKSFSREQCLSRAAEVKFLVCNDHATGVSVEFLPLEKRAINRSVVKDGYAFAHIRWKGLGWAHTYGGQQINPGAQTVSQKARPETVDLIRSGKMPDGRKFSEVVLKAFAPLLTDKPAVTSGFVAKSKDATGHEHGDDGKFAGSGSSSVAAHPAPPKLNRKHLMTAHAETIRRANEADKSGDAEGARAHRAAAYGYAKAASHLDDGNKAAAAGVLAVAHEFATGKRKLQGGVAKALPNRVEKSMDDYSDAYPAPETAAAPPVEQPDSDVPHEVSTSYDVGQIVADCVEKLRQSGNKSLHKQSKKFFAKLAERWEGDVEDLLAHAENTEAEAGMGGEEPDKESDADPDDADAPADGDGPPKDDAADDDKKDEKAHRFAYGDDGFPINHDVHLTRDPQGWLVTKSRYEPRLRLCDLKPVTKTAPTSVSVFDLLDKEVAEVRSARQEHHNIRRNRTRR